MSSEAIEKPSRSRRHFLKMSAATLALMSVGLPTIGSSSAFAADLGHGDVGILKYAYALEQLEAAFYTQVLKHPYHHMSDKENTILSDIR